MATEPRGEDLVQDIKALMKKYGVSVEMLKSPIQETRQSPTYACPDNMLPVTNDWGDVTGYVPKPPDYWEEPGY